MHTSRQMQRLSSHTKRTMMPSVERTLIEWYKLSHTCDNADFK